MGPAGEPELPRRAVLVEPEGAHRLAEPELALQAAPASPGTLGHRRRELARNGQLLAGTRQIQPEPDPHPRRRPGSCPA